MKTILLADDETNLRMLVRTTLEDPQYRILEAVDGVVFQFSICFLLYRTGIVVALLDDSGCYCWRLPPGRQ